MDPKTIDKNPYLGKTKHQPRPVGPEDGKFGVTGRADLARDQKAWDQAQAWAKGNDELHAQRVAGIAAKRAADADARRAAEADAVLDDLRARYLGRNPGATEADFARDREEVVRQSRISRTLAEPVAPPIDRRVYGI